jgi:hypothetical protein
MSLQYFVIELSHDNGKTYLKTAAQNAQTAKSNTMNCEACPESAIKLMEIPRGLFSMGAEYLFNKFFES